ncbi:U3 small nucleolar ribonucleoprotein protein MPP10 [Anopheles arabiensis]|uniref:U3 small nucleolar ribonucleoprotein protein MPP10 n=1 Tax=Anopheles arabiensis TaxID=7173 RepID=A0A182I775_ANOAR|nr:U3 small nucleolar ribonucleoprotein protein MPP10 [Anopheles arabiensis]
MVKATTASPLPAGTQLDLKSYVKEFRKHIKHPENFMKVQKPLAKKLKQFVKEIYDRGTKNATVTQDGPALPYLDELVTEEMDDEQIWQQLELKNDHFIDQDLKKFLEVVSKNEKRLQLPFTTKTQSEVGDDSGAGSSGEEMEMDSDEENEANGDGMESEEEDEQDGEEMDSDEELTEKKSKKLKKKDKNGKKKKKQLKGKKSVVDDRFFKLDDMARFLDEEDERERRRQYGLAEKNPLIEVDYFDEHTGEDDGDISDLKYSDFFEDEDDEDDDTDEDDDEEEKDDDAEEEDEDASAAEEEDEDEDDEEDEDDDEDESPDGQKDEEEGELSDEAEMERNRKLRYEIYKGENGMSPPRSEKPPKKAVIDQPDTSDSEEEKAPDGPKSSYELRQEKLKEKISKMEAGMLKDKPWQLKGEISAETRPKNSLLEEVLQYEHTTRPAPVVTEDTTMRLEDIIKQRIRNKAFDDVERKVRPPDNPREYRKQLVLDGEKSKLSLAQVYEQDYLKQLELANPDAAAQAGEEEEPKEHKEIRSMMKVVLAQLDALSNFHYTPRPAVPELKILTNTPAISMEEVAPVATSDATLLAPEEVHRRPKADVMSKDERTKTDQNRERRLKKRFQREKYRRETEREQRQLEKASASGMAKQNRALQTSLMKKVTKAKNVQQMAETSTGPSKSSTAFFSQLQDEVRSQVKAKTDGTKKKKKNTENLIASNFKL